MKNLTRIAIAVLTLAPLAGFAQTLAPSQDAYYVPAVGTNFGTATTVTVGSSSSVGLVQFDLTQLPAGVTAAQIQKATLTLFLDHVGSSGTINVDTVSASTPWGELTVNGNSGVSAGSAVATSVTVATADTFIAMDATAAVQGWITTPSSNNGFMLIANTGTIVQFDSKESTTTSHPATLTIVLASNGPIGPTGPTGLTGPTGANGTAGTNGAAGATGPAGAAGATGSAGAAGATGSAGAAGATGPAGAAGATGSAGAAGATGPAGAAGATGPAGAAGATGAAGTAGAMGPAGAAGATGPAGAAGATGATGTLSTTFFEFNAVFNDSNDNGSNLFFSPELTNGNNGATSPAFSSSNVVVVPLACTVSQLSVGALLTTTGNGAQTATITLYHGTGVTPASTPITCTTASIANSVGSKGSCADNTHTVTVAPGDTLSLQLSETENTSAAPVVTFAVHLRCQ